MVKKIIFSFFLSAVDNSILNC